MKFETKPSNASSPCAYVTAPTSPNEYTTTEFYYSAPVSPARRKPANPIATNGNLYHHPSSNFGDFEFETSKKFGSHLQFESSDHFDYYRDPHPSMAFADELFLNGLVMPLKLPPRLQYDSDCNTSFSHKSTNSSPRKDTCKKVPFARKSSRYDGFDPFMVALQKVREDKRGRNSRAQRRSRSYSPFRAIVTCSRDCTYYADQDFPEENRPVERTIKGPSFSGPLDFKGSDYARWVRDQRLRAKSPRRFLLGERVRPLRNNQAETNKPENGKKYDNREESKMQKLKSFITRYALFGRGSKQAKTRSEKKKTKYYSRLGFKSSENAQNNGKRKMSAN
ncbi:hypothetical protein CASFOL_002994 [Castilleja foliolosa]|uniref:Uncharacterized protein n=1 Tax=Castilleja foliolosa TaxID=1961234 RepID=A0ABD3EG64_9LAMI